MNFQSQNTILCMPTTLHNNFLSGVFTFTCKPISVDLMADSQNDSTLEEVSEVIIEQRSKLHYWCLSIVSDDLTAASQHLRALLSHDFTTSLTLTGFLNSIRVMEDLGVSVILSEDEYN